jgi:hypothetical protein
MREHWRRSAGRKRLTDSMRWGWRPLCGVAAATLAVAAASGVASAASGSTRPAATPTVTAGLGGVTALSATDAWAVGDVRPVGGYPISGLIEHWNGTQWATAATISVTGSNVNLSKVSADSATDAWAVGSAQVEGSPPTALIEHWNGTKWTRTATPSLNGGWLYGVSAVSPTNAWAVGYYNNSKGDAQVLVLQWNGKSWSQAPAANPNPNFSAFLESVSATSASNAWAVGYDLNRSGATQVLLLHYNGTSWTQDTSAKSAGTLWGVSADSAADAWATGYNASGKTLILHHTSAGWARVTSPNPGTGVNTTWPVLTVSALSPTEVWAAGAYSTTGTTPNKLLILRGTGTTWKQMPAASPAGVNSNTLSAVSANSATSAWAVGEYQIPTALGVSGTLILHWNGTSWIRVASPN